MKNILIISGESSGELYGSLLAKAIMKKTKDIKISGMGGVRMRQSGVDIITPICSAFGLTELFKSISHIKQAFKKIKTYLHNTRPDVVILIDYPDFNIRVAKEAKRLRIPVLYYVSPQVWAWRKKRIYTIKRLADKIALILPFEVDIYKSIDMPCQFVGHPVLDDIDEFLRQQGFSLKNWDKNSLKVHIKKQLNIQSRYVIALLPGSRRHEIKGLIYPIVDTAVEILKRHKDVSFVLPIAPNLDEQTIKIIDDALSPIHKHTKVIRDNTLFALSCADIGIIASGTATFQATILDVPMVVIYRVSMLSYAIGRLLIKVNYMTLTNLLLEKTIMDGNLPRIKELLQGDVNPENILREVDALLSNSAYYDAMLDTFGKVRDLYLQHNASETVCSMALDMIYR
ncbi:MAG: lipid-A-disaccharide synthase [Thermodesulfovibrionales bacterium]